MKEQEITLNKKETFVETKKISIEEQTEKLQSDKEAFAKKIEKSKDDEFSGRVTVSINRFLGGEKIPNFLNRQ